MAIEVYKLGGYILDTKSRIRLPRISNNFVYGASASCVYHTWSTPTFYFENFGTIVHKDGKVNKQVEYIIGRHIYDGEPTITGGMDDFMNTFARGYFNAKYREHARGRDYSSSNHKLKIHEVVGTLNEVRRALGVNDAKIAVFAFGELALLSNLKLTD